MKIGLTIFAVIAMFALIDSAHGQKDERLYGVWEMTYYARDGNAIDWTGMMIITPGHFSRIYMHKDRPVIQDRYKNLSDLTDEEKNTIVDIFVPKFGGASGTYRIEGTQLFFQPIFVANPGLKGREPSRMFTLDRDRTTLTLKGTYSRGYEVEEIWVKREDIDERE